VSITDEIIGISQLLEAHARAAPKSLRLCTLYQISRPYI